MRVETVHDDPRLLEAFLRLPEAVYADDPSWIAPFRVEVARQIDPAAPFDEGVQKRSFVALRGDEPVARAAALVHPRLLADGQPVGQVGFFEARYDPEAAAAVLEAATGWLRAQGLARAWGPMNGTIWHAYRFMTVGHETEPFLGEPRNPYYYPALFEAFGFQPLARWRSWDLSRAQLEAMAMASEMLKGTHLEDGYRYEPFRLDEAGFALDLPRAHEVLQEGFSENLGYTPLPLAEFAALFGGMRAFLIPELSPFSVDPTGRTIGVGYLYPDAGPALRELKGDASRLGELPALLAARPPSRLVFHTMAVRKPDRRPKLVESYLHRLLGHLLARPELTAAVGALAKEGRTIYEKTGEPTREYALYALDLAG